MVNKTSDSDSSKPRFAVRSMNASLAVCFASIGATTVAANELACTILLCLSNPAGYAAVGECLGPVSNFVQSVAIGGGAPMCDGNSGQMMIGRGKKANQRTIDWTDSAGVRQRLNY
jgi:hypothetical protein